MRTEEPKSKPQAHGGVFATTQWSVVLAAGGRDTPQAAAALEQLCRTYWYPLYAYVRRQGYPPEDAQDLTQGFFALLLARESLADVRPEHGRFRCFILVALKRFLVNERERAGAAKRGGSIVHIPIDGRAAEERYSLEAAHQCAPDKLFDRAWGLGLLEAASHQMEEEYHFEGKDKLFERLKLFLPGDERALTYAAAGVALGLTEGAVKVAVHRLRRRYRDLLREQVSQTVSSFANLEDELASLRAAFYET